MIKKAKELKRMGYTIGQIADTLNVSKDTALWLVTHEEIGKEIRLEDIYIDLSTISKDAYCISAISSIMARLIKREIGEKNVDVVLGISNAGIPYALKIAEILDSEFGIIIPRKHMWEPSETERKTFLLDGFAKIYNRNVVIIDDVITSGTTMKEAIALVKEMRGNPILSCVIVDKKGLKEIDGVKVLSLIKLTII